MTLSDTQPVFTYNITYELNGGTNAAGNPTTYSNTTGATLADATKTGYTFGGWYDNAQFNGTAITEIPAGLTGNKTVYAKWTANTYSVAFNNNGGSGTMSNMSFTYDEDPKPLTSNTFTRTGYTYSGWNTAANGSGTAYTDGQSVQNLTDANGATVTLFAQWSPITYTVSFNTNGGTGTMAAQTHTYDVSLALTANTFTLTGYSFDGWATTADGDVAYTDEQTVSNLASTQNANVTLFAKWSPVLSYFWGEGNDGSYANPYIITTTAGLDLLATLVNGGNDFRGKYFRLGANIEYDSDVVNNFTPIGGYINGTDKFFNGNFSGQGSDGTQYEISGININKPDDRYIGLFGASYNNATLDNIVLRDATITGKLIVGGVVGVNSGSIYNCRVFNTSVTANSQVAASGIICGASFNRNRLDNNYYYDCSAKSGNGATKTANIGTGNHHDIDGAKSIHKLSLGNYVNTTTSPTLTYKGTDYYAVGTPITLSYSGTVSEDKTLFFTVNGEVIDDSTLIETWADDNEHDVMLLDRKLWKDGDWNTLCLPFGISDFDGTIFADADIRALSSASLDDGVLTLNFTPATGEGAVTNITAGQPYLVKWDGSEGQYVENPVFTDVTISSTAPATDVISTDQKVQFLGTYSPAAIDKDNKACLFLGAANTLYWPDADNYKVGAFRAYFKVDLGGGLGVYPAPTQVRAIVLNFGDEENTQGISEAMPLNDKGEMINDGWYNLHGVKVEKPTKKGLYIVNGRKVVIP